MEGPPECTKDGGDGSSMAGVIHARRYCSNRLPRALSHFRPSAADLSWPSNFLGASRTGSRKRGSNRTTASGAAQTLAQTLDPNPRVANPNPNPSSNPTCLTKLCLLLTFQLAAWAIHHSKGNQKAFSLHKTRRKSAHQIQSYKRSKFKYFFAIHRNKVSLPK